MANQANQPLDPALPANLAEYLAMGREIGADGALVVRLPQVARLLLDFGQDVGLDGVDLANFEHPAGMLLILRFPASDGGQAGVEVVGK